MGGEFRGTGRDCFTLGLEGLVRTLLFQDWWEAIESFFSFFNIYLFGCARS